VLQVTIVITTQSLLGIEKGIKLTPGRGPKKDQQINVAIRSTPMWGISRLSLALLMAVSTTAMADLEISEAKLRLLPGDLPAAGYFTLTNKGSQPVTLTGAQSSDFAQAMMHRSSRENGMASMQHVEQLEVPAGATLTFASGSYHLMLLQRQRALSLGDQIEVTLLFVDGKRLPVTFTAVPPLAAGQQ